MHLRNSIQDTGRRWCRVVGVQYWVLYCLCPVTGEGSLCLLFALNESDVQWFSDQHPSIQVSHGLRGFLWK